MNRSSTATPNLVTVVRGGANQMVALRLLHEGANVACNMTHNTLGSR